MAISIENFAKRYPFLYHATYTGGWHLVQKYGIHSTSSLLDLCNITGEARRRIESNHRPESVSIALPEGEMAIIRDQKPMSEKVLKLVLENGFTVQQWYELLNRRIFFWTSKNRLNRILKTYLNKPQEVLTIDTRALLTMHQERVKLSHINSGAVAPAYAKRGPELFKPLADFPRELWVKGSRAVAEVTVEGSIKDISSFVVCVEMSS